VLLSLTIGAAEDIPHPFFFFVVTDPQLGMYDHNRDLSRESENLEKLVAAANRLHPAFIVNCGDIVNRPGDSREIKRYQSIMAKLDSHIPVYNVPGNHDLKNRPTSESLAAYRRAFGPDYYTFDFQGFEGIVLNSSLIKCPELVPREAEEQSAWLQTVLARVHDHPVGEVVIFQHIPWFLHDADEAENYSNLPPLERSEYFDRFSQAGIHFIFAGHYHDNALGSEEGIQMRTVSALGKPLGKAESGFGIVVVKGHELNFTYYPISAPPERIPM